MIMRDVIVDVFYILARSGYVIHKLNSMTRLRTDYTH